MVDKTTFYKNTVKSRVYDTVASNSLENKKNEFSVLKCAEETTKKWALTT